jgi:hypothetical protein
MHVGICLGPERAFVDVVVASPKNVRDCLHEVVRDRLVVLVVQDPEQKALEVAG